MNESGFREMATSQTNLHMKTTASFVPSDQAGLTLADLPQTPREETKDPTHQQNDS